MKIKDLLAYTAGLFLLVASLNSVANITFNVSPNFPKHFYCHFKVYGRYFGSSLRGGEWSDHYYAGSSYYEEDNYFERNKIIASCFDESYLEKIQSTGHVCYSLKDGENKNTVINITRSGSHVTLSPMGNQC